jgi:hypothetical protein
VYPALVKAATAAREAAQGHRNATLFAVACRYGEALALGKIEVEEADRVLMEIAETTGLAYSDGDRAVRATINKGLRTGMTS